jgi:hypothetical protein
MDHDERAQFVCNSEEAVQLGVGQLGVPDLRADLDAEEARLAHAAMHLIHSPVGILQRDGAKGGKAGWMLANDVCEELVLRHRQFGGTGRRRPVAECHGYWRKHLHGNAFAIHVD